MASRKWLSIWNFQLPTKTTTTAAAAAAAGKKTGQFGTLAWTLNVNVGKGGQKRALKRLRQNKRFICTRAEEKSKNK